MKRFLLFLIVFLYGNPYCFAIDNWEVQIIDNRGSFSDIFFIGQEGWAVGYSSTVVDRPSTILYTSDNGKNWLDQNPGTRVRLNSVYFINPKEGWAVGSGSYIIHTTDGGVRWTTERAWGDVNFQSITFTDENTGWIIGFDQLNKELVMYKTTDSGINWVKNVLNVPCYSLSKIFFIDSQNGWISGSYPSRILRTTDGGLNWTIKDLGVKESINSLFFIDENEGWAVGGHYERLTSINNIILHTTDGGDNWTIQSNDRPYYLNDVIFVNNQCGWAVGGAPAMGCGKYSSYIAKTTDGGITWEDKYIPVYCDLQGLFIDKELNGWAVGVDNFGDGCILYSGLKLGESSTEVSGENVNDKNYYIYPNPATDFIEITDEKMVVSELQILSLTGHEVIRTKNQKMIDISQLSPGIYFIKSGNRIFKLFKI